MPDTGRVIAPLVLAGLVLAAALSGTRGLGGAVVLAGISILWLIVNQPMEGPTLVELAQEHGITGADLAGVVGLGLAAHRAREIGRRSRPRA